MWGFQSSPGLVTGRYDFSFIAIRMKGRVSILARSGDRALRGVMSKQPHQCCFNPRPVW